LIGLLCDVIQGILTVCIAYYPPGGHTASTKGARVIGGLSTVFFLQLTL